MAINDPTKLSDFSGFINREQAQPIFERAARQSVVQQLVPEIPLAFNGKAIPVITGRPVAGWVAEGATKPATKGTMTLKTMDPKKLAAIAVVSEEVVRADPGKYASTLEQALGDAFAIAFDYASLHNLGGDGTGTGPFATYVDQTTKAVELGGNTQGAGGVYKDLVDSMDFVIGSKDATGRRRRVTGFAFEPTVETRLRGAVDTTGQPLYSDLPTNADSDALAVEGRVLGRRAFMGEGVANPTGTIQGYTGDWSQAAWGVVGGINYSLSNQATVTINGSLVSLWENNLVAIRAEAEYGFLLNDADAFCQLRNNVGS